MCRPDTGKSYTNFTARRKKARARFGSGDRYQNRIEGNQMPRASTSIDGRPSLIAVQTEFLNRHAAEAGRLALAGRISYSLSHDHRCSALVSILFFGSFG
jgi:hypothetical protein